MNEVATQKKQMKFRDIFDEDASECLELKFDVEVKGKKYTKGYKFTASEELGGVNFHKYRYLDLAVIDDEKPGILKIVGFYPSRA